MQEKNVQKKGFSNVFATLQALDVIFYYTDHCGYCKMTLAMLEQEGASKAITMKNLKDPNIEPNSQNIK